jgi:hypothetical protein
MPPDLRHLPPQGAAPLVVGQPPGVGGRLRPISPELLAAIGEKDLASLAICEDTDGVGAPHQPAPLPIGRQARSAGGWRWPSISGARARPPA